MKLQLLRFGEILQLLAASQRWGKLQGVDFMCNCCGGWVDIDFGHTRTALPMITENILRLLDNACSKIHFQSNTDDNNSNPETHPNDRATSDTAAMTTHPDWSLVVDREDILIFLISQFVVCEHVKDETSNKQEEKHNTVLKQQI